MRRIAGLLLLVAVATGDGKVMPPRDYEGSLEEKAQEAILVFRDGVEDLVLKITVAGEADRFGWVVPFPSRPKVAKADARLFRELFDYVEARSRRARKAGKSEGALAAGAERKSVDVLERKIVGSFDVALVKENEPGALNVWLTDHGFQPIAGGEDVLGFYRRKGYVLACVKVSDAALRADEPADLHPLHFRFETGGKDGIYFPMRMTGLQREPFDVNLYVFYRYWLNDALSRYGYVHRGFDRRYRDWDSSKCEPNGGKTWDEPARDTFLAPYAKRLSKVAAFLRKHHAGERFYLTNIQGRFRPAAVRRWDDDLWLFPYYTNRAMVPYDARPGGPAAAGYSE